MKNIFPTQIVAGLALLFGLAIATSTALMSSSSIALMVLAIFIPEIKNNLKIALANKYIIACCVFFALFVVGSLWSSADYAARIKMLGRMIAYATAPLLFISLLQPRAAQMLLKGFVLGAVFSAILSFLTFIFQHPILQGSSDGLTDGALFKWTIFRGHLLHNAFLAMAASFILCWLLFKQNLPKFTKIFWGVLYLICLCDVMFLVQGRTGQIMFLFMSLFVVLYRFRLKGIVYGLMAGIVILPLLFFTAPALKNGINEFKSEQTQLQRGDYNTSAGLRHQFHDNSLALIKQHPILGTGTGSFAAEYAKQVANTNFIRTKNPHGDLYLIGVELGLVGILGFIAVLIANCRELIRPNNDQMYSCMGFTLLFGYLVALTQNSFFMDNVSGLAYLLLTLSIFAQLRKAQAAND